MRRVRGRPLAERHWAITVGAGLVGACVIIGTLGIVDRVPKPVGGTLCLLTLFAVPAAAPWGVFRDD